MRDLLFPVLHDGKVGLQTQLRRHLVDAILDGRLAPDGPLPSCRRLARSLGVSRNTVVLAYQALADEGLLISRQRVGYFVNAEIMTEAAAPDQPPARGPARNPAKWSSGDWRRRLRIQPSTQIQITKPENWQSYPYPFVYGQVDRDLFPVAAWRTCSRQALGVESIRSWSEDSFDRDDPQLIDEVRKRVLPRRGVRAAPEEILITLGAQNALYLVAQLLAGRGTKVGIENPGYVDARNIFDLGGAEIRPIPVDEKGMKVGAEVAACDCVYVTPSHQWPTTVTLPLDRRVALLEAAGRRGFFVIEDDYEPEANFVGAPTSALKAMDRGQSVIYVGSFSKSLAPGLRMGYLVASAEFVEEARLLRRMMLRHPPANNQRTLALFIAGGYYEALAHRLQRVYRDRWEAMGAALAEHLPTCAAMSSHGGTATWVRGPEGLDTERLAEEALDAGIVIEPGRVHFLDADAPRNFFRLGFSSIKAEKIGPGIEKLGTLIAELA